MKTLTQIECSSETNEEVDRVDALFGYGTESAHDLAQGGSSLPGPVAPQTLRFTTARLTWPPWNLSGGPPAWHCHEAGSGLPNNHTKRYSAPQSPSRSMSSDPRRRSHPLL